MSIDGHAVLTDFGLAKDFTTRGSTPKNSTSKTATATSTTAVEGGAEGDGASPSIVSSADTTDTNDVDKDKDEKDKVKDSIGLSDRSATLNEDGERTRTLCGTTEYMAPGI